MPYWADAQEASDQITSEAGAAALVQYVQRSPDVDGSVVAAALRLLATCMHHPVAVKNLALSQPLLDALVALVRQTNAPGVSMLPPVSRTAMKTIWRAFNALFELQNSDHDPDTGEVSVKRVCKESPAMIRAAAFFVMNSKGLEPPLVEACAFGVLLQ